MNRYSLDRMTERERKIKRTQIEHTKLIDRKMKKNNKFWNFRLRFARINTVIMQLSYLIKLYEIVR